MMLVQISRCCRLHGSSAPGHNGVEKSALRLGGAARVARVCHTLLMLHKLIKKLSTLARS